jgi:hypothetical protein
VLASAVAEIETQRRSMASELDALTDAHGSVTRLVETIQETVATQARRAPRPKRGAGPEAPPEDPVTPRLRAVEQEIHTRLSAIEKTVNAEIGESREDVTRRLALLEERWADSLEERLAEMIDTEKRPSGRRPRREPEG